MLLSQELFVNFDRSSWVSDPLVLDIKVAHFPGDVGFSMDFLLNLFLIQEPSDSDLIKAWHVTLLLNALIVNVSKVTASVQETRFNRLDQSDTLRSMSQTFCSILVPDFIRNEVMVFKIFDGVLAKFLVGFAFVSFCAWIVEQESTELDFEPCWNVRVAI
jgi:hypothetical protein